MYNLFVSHSWHYRDSYSKLLAALQDDKRFTFTGTDLSDEEAWDADAHSAQLEAALAQKMKSASCVVMLADGYNMFQQLCLAEILAANSLNLPIIAVSSVPMDFIPKGIKICAMDIVSWNVDRLISSIERYARKQQD